MPECCTRSGGKSTMAQFNSSNSKATSFGDGMLQVARTMATSVMAITAVLVFAGIIFGLTGCTTEKNTEASVKPGQINAGPAVSLLPPASSGSSASSVEPASTRKRTVIPRPATLTYTSRIYGVSFRFPGQYELTTPGDGGKSSLAEEVPNNFIHAGGIPVATIELPSGSAVSFFSVSANKLLTSQECDQFAIP